MNAFRALAIAGCLVASARVAAAQAAAPAFPAAYGQSPAVLQASFAQHPGHMPPHDSSGAPIPGTGAAPGAPPAMPGTAAQPPPGAGPQGPPGAPAGWTAGPAAPPPQGPPPLTEGERPDDDLGHRKQGHLRAEFVTGYRMFYRYKPSPRCAPYDPQKTPDDQQKFCGYGAAPALGLAVGFSLIDSFEPFVFMRFGLANEARETNHGKLLQVGFGARLYTMPTSRFKIFFTPWLGVDATGGPLEPIDARAPLGSPGGDDARAGIKEGAYKTDLLAHFGLGPQYDFTRNFGMYLSGGLTFQFVRYFGATADVVIGIQARAP